MTPPGIDPGTARLVAQGLNHYTTPGASWEVTYGVILFPHRTNVHNGLYRQSLSFSSRRKPALRSGQKHTSESFSADTKRTVTLITHSQYCMLYSLQFIHKFKPPTTSRCMQNDNSAMQIKVFWDMTPCLLVNR